MVCVTYTAGREKPIEMGGTGNDTMIVLAIAGLLLTAYLASKSKG